MESVPQALLAVVTLAIWNGSETLEFHAPRDFVLVLVLFGIGPLVWRKQSAVLAAALLAATYATILFNATFWYGAAGTFTSAFSFSALLIALSRLGEKTALSRRICGVLTVFGWTGFLVCAYILSFRGAVRDVLRWSRQQEADGTALWIYSWGLFACAVLAWLGLLVDKLRGTGRANVRVEEWLCPIALLYSQGMAVAGIHMDAGFVAVVFNLASLGIATAWMVRGCRTGEMRPVVLGSLFFALLVFARYFDLFDGLAMRGLAFLILGGVLFAEGFYYRRMRRDVDEEGRTS